MIIPGLVTVAENAPADLERAVDIVGGGFMEEQWFACWLEALDDLGATDARKREILRATIADSFAAHVPYQGVYLLEDRNVAMGMVRASELRGRTHEELEDASTAAFDAVATPAERDALEARAQAMAPASDFGWSDAAAEGRDHIYAYALSVSPDARGTGALRRLFEAIFSYADEEGLDVYLECYTDRLEQLYAHFGFEPIDVLSVPELDLHEHRMVRRALTRARA